MLLRVCDKRYNLEYAADLGNGINREINTFTLSFVK
jgi:hypothetical protein